MSDFFGGLGNLMKGFSAFMPQDDPATQELITQNEISELTQREQALYAQIGKRLFDVARAREDMAETISEIETVQSQLIQAKVKLEKVQQEKSEKERLEQELKDATTCPNCGEQHEQGVKFCQQCGSKLGIPKRLNCKRCGCENPPDTRFCGECGAKLT